MSADDLLILPFGACVFSLLIAGLILMSEYEDRIRRDKSDQK